jgi:hypothetical protein
MAGRRARAAETPTIGFLGPGISFRHECVDCGLRAAAPSRSNIARRRDARGFPKSRPTAADDPEQRSGVASWLVLALRTWICSPMARAADSTSLNVVSVFVALAGLTSTATRVAAGTRSRSISSRFATNSPLRKLIPVALPPGRARLATRPSLTGSSAMLKTMGMVVVAALAANAAATPNAAITETWRRTSSAASAGSRSN